MYMYVYNIYIYIYIQVLSGTGGGRVAFEFMARFVGKNTPIYMPDPTWANHLPMAKDAGLSLATYRYCAHAAYAHLHVPSRYSYLLTCR